MYKTIKPSALSAIAFISLSISSHSNAATISGLFPQPGIYSIASQTWVNGAPNNDNFVGTGNPNVLSIIQKHYTGNTGGAVAPVDIIVRLDNSGGTTEYAVVENVQNSTGIDWVGYRVELGFGSGVSFVPSTPGDGLDFDDEDDSPMNFSPLPADFTTITRPSEDEIVASDGTLLDGQFGGTDFIFHIDVPDGITEFTLRQQPLLIPEPSTLTLLGLVSLAALRRRR